MGQNEREKSREISFPKLSRKSRREIQCKLKMGYIYVYIHPLIFWPGIIYRRKNSKGMPQGSAWFITGKKAKTEKKQSNNSLTREHNEHRNAWVPSQGEKELGLCVKLFRYKQSSAGDIEGPSYTVAIIA